MPLFNITEVKEILKESGGSNNPNLAVYGKMADNLVWSDLISVKGISDPLTTSMLPQKTIDKIKSHATSITVAYFYKFESGDTITSESAEISWKQFFQNQFQRPRFISSTGF